MWSFWFDDRWGKDCSSLNQGTVYVGEMGEIIRDCSKIKQKPQSDTKAGRKWEEN